MAGQQNTTHSVHPWMEQNAPYHAKLLAQLYFQLYRFYLHQKSVQYNHVNRKPKPLKQVQATKRYVKV